MVMSNLLAGGAELAALELVRALSKQGYKFTVAAIKTGGVLHQPFEAAGTKVYEPVVRRRLDILAPFRIAGIIRREKIQALIVVDAPRDGLLHGCVGAVMSAKKPLKLCWCHSRPFGQAGNVAGRLGWHLKLGLLDAMVCISNYQRDQFAKLHLPRERMCVIHNGIDLERFASPAKTDLKLPAGKKIIVQVANVMPDKDFNTLIKATAILSQRRDDFHLILAGRSTDSNEMVYAIEREGISNDVTLAGHRDDIAAIVSSADIFVLSSFGEVQNLSVLEAMAAGTPVIVSDIPAFDKMVADGTNGMKFPPGDSQALAGAMEELLENPQRRKALSAAALETAKKFSLETMAHNFDRVLRKISK